MISEAEFKESKSGSDETEKKIEDELKRQEMTETLERIIVKFFIVAANMGETTKKFSNQRRKWLNANPTASLEEMLEVKKEIFNRMKGEL